MLPRTLAAYIAGYSGRHQVALALLSTVVFALTAVPLELQRRIVNDAVYAGARGAGAYEPALDLHQYDGCPRGQSGRVSTAPSVEALLGIDREYRETARAGIALHHRQGPWDFTALWSGVELAQEHHSPYDWVVIFFSDVDGEDGQLTVVTERRGSLMGKRVVRGRELECARYYAAPTSSWKPD